MKLKDLFEKYLRYYEAKDLEGVASMVAPDAVLQDWNLRVEGKAAFLSETRKNFEAADSLRIDILSSWEGAWMAAGELKITVNGKEVLAVVDVFEFNSEGLIVASRAYKGYI